MPVEDGPRVRRATAADVPAVTRLVRDAFDVWKERGLDLSPMRQTEEQTAAYLPAKGYVAEDSAGRIVATFSVDDAKVTLTPEGVLEFQEGSDAPVLFELQGDPEDIPVGELIVFKRLAVAPASGRAGLGTLLYSRAEAMARREGTAGIVLETVKEADWLYTWYCRLGFRVVGGHRYPGRPLVTLLMCKTL